MKYNVLAKTKARKIYKNKKLNNANFQDYGLGDYRVFLFLLSKVRGTDSNGIYLNHSTLLKNYSITAKEFAREFMIDLDNSYKILRDSCNSLASTVITLDQPEIFEIWKIPVCTLAKYNRGTGTLSIELNHHIMPYLMQVKKRFVLYNLKEIANFSSLYTIRLYELIQEFKDTGYIIKTVDTLRHVFAVGDTYKQYADFKRKTFLHAINEINSQYDMSLSFEEVKTGRKVTSIKFTFKRATAKKAYNPQTKNMCNVYKSPQVINDDKQSTLLDTENITPTNNNKKPHKKLQKHITSKEQLVVDIMLKLLEENPKLNKKEALRKARECVETD